MIDSIRKFIEGILGVPAEEDLDKGSFVDNEFTAQKDIKSRSDDSLNTSQQEKDNTDFYEDAGDLPVAVVVNQPTQTRSIFTSNVAFENMLSYYPPYEDAVQVISPRFLWCLDNGHGRLQAGKRSPVWEDGKQLEEWRYTRQIVKKIIQRLEIIGIQFFNVVPEEDVGSFLPERVDRADSKQSDLGLKKIYVSIHGNAAGVPEASGVECWHFLGSSEGKKLASVFQKHIFQSLKNSEYDHTWEDRGIRTLSPASRNFFVLRETSMPAVLTENGFYTHRDECQLMMNPDVQQIIADAHVAAILEIEQNGFEDIAFYEKSIVIHP